MPRVQGHSPSVSRFNECYRSCTQTSVQKTRKTFVPTVASPVMRLLNTIPNFELFHHCQHGTAFLVLCSAQFSRDVLRILDVHFQLDSLRYYHCPVFRACYTRLVFRKMSFWKVLNSTNEVSRFACPFRYGPWISGATMSQSSSIEFVYSI